MEVTVDDLPGAASWPEGVRVAHQYAVDVLSGDIPACKWVKAACRRQLDDLADADVGGWPFYYDPDAAERVIRYIELLPHVRGRWVGSTIELEPWQKFSLACVFGWKRHADGARRFTRVYEEVPRKNAKTTKMAGVGLYMLTADDEFGAEVYAAATTEDQARVVFEIAQSMARSSGAYRARFGVDVFKSAVVVKDSDSKFVPLSGKGSALDGLNVSCGLVDELHAHAQRLVHDVLDSATGARSQPLLWRITTAGSNRAGVCYDVRAYMCKVLNATLERHDGMGYRLEGASAEDAATWGIIYTIDAGDDPLDPETWRKANPNYGISVNPDDLATMAAKARQQPAALNEFLTKRLNVWVNADQAWMNMLDWDACADPSLTEEDFRGARCVIGMDAAWKRDLFSTVKVFEREGRYYVFHRSYMPARNLERSGWEQVEGWVREGWITTTAGDTLDIEAVRGDIIGDSLHEGDIARHEVAEVGYDPVQIAQFAKELEGEGLTVTEVRPSVLNFSPAMKECEELVAAGRLRHNGDPVLAWAISNVVCHVDAKDNIYPRKEGRDRKIDPAIALFIALALVIKPKESEPASFWEANA